MRITDLDKRRAIKRLPEFKKDYAQYNNLKTEGEITQFKINFLKKWGYEFEAILHADDVAKHRQDTPTVEVVTRITDAPYIIIHEGEEKTPSHLFGDSLYLKVTLEGKTETQLVKDFKRVIGPYRNLLQANISAETKGERNRKTDITEGIWAIYDLNLKTNNKCETTRQWFNVSGAFSGVYADEPGYSDEKYLKQVQTAIANAEAIIASVRKEYDLKK